MLKIYPFHPLSFNTKKIYNNYSYQRESNLRILNLKKYTKIKHLWSKLFTHLQLFIKKRFWPLEVSNMQRKNSSNRKRQIVSTYCKTNELKHLHIASKVKNTSTHSPQVGFLVNRLKPTSIQVLAIMIQLWLDLLHSYAFSAVPYVQ